MDIQILANELCGQKDKYIIILEMTRKQKELIVIGDMDQLVEVMEKKRMLLDEIDLMNKKIAPLKSKWMQEKRILPKENVAAVESAIDALALVLQELIKLEGEAGNLMQNQSADISKKLTELQQKQRAKGAYNVQRGEDDSVFDSTQ